MFTDRIDRNLSVYIKPIWAKVLDEQTQRKKESHLEEVLFVGLNVLRLHLYKSNTFAVNLLKLQMNEAPVMFEAVNIW